MGAGLNTRDWLYVKDHCSAIGAVLRRGRTGDTYLIGGRSERRNIDIAREICGILDEMSPPRKGLYSDLLTSVTDRLGHDFRYAIDSSMIESELGWRATETFDTGIKEDREVVSGQSDASGAERFRRRRIRFQARAGPLSAMLAHRRAVAVSLESRRIKAIAARAENVKASPAQNIE